MQKQAAFETVQENTHKKKEGKERKNISLNQMGQNRTHSACRLFKSRRKEERKKKLVIICQVNQKEIHF